MISATIFRVCPPQEPTSNTWTVSLFNIFHATKTHSDYRILLATLQPAVNLAPSAGRILRPFAIFPLSRKHWWPRCSWSRWTAEKCEDAERSTAQQATSQPGSPGYVDGLPTQGMNGQWTSHHFWKKKWSSGCRKTPVNTLGECSPFVRYFSMFQPWHSQNIGVLSDQKLTGSLVNCRDCLPMSLGWGRTVFFIFEKKKIVLKKVQQPSHRNW